MSKLYILYEHAAGFGVFKVQEFEEIGMFIPQLEAAIKDLSRFNSIVKLEGFFPFKTAISALENINAISEGLLPEDLKIFLDITIPKSKKKDKISLGLVDPRLGAAISEALGIQCTHVGAVPEILRGIRHHHHHLIKGFTAKSSAVAQLGLGHAYSRAKVKFNVHRVDNMIIQAIALLDQLDKDVNTFSMRIREWYSYHFPELVKIIPENYTFARLAKFIKNRKELTQDSLPGLEEITMDSGKAQAILEASKSSMGMDISIVDLINVEMCASRVVALADYRNQLSEYLRSKMSLVAPNLGKLIGDQVGARLIAHAGSLTNLAKCPASTVQILGAEKALFRALKTRGNTPKYGLLFHSTFIGRAGAQNKGRISRYLANKCAIASRIDCFTEQPTHIFGDKLRQQVEDRLKFYETGDIPKKNVEVMQEAMQVFEQQMEQIKSEKKKKKKKNKLNSSEVQNESVVEDAAVTESSKKKKKKRKLSEMQNVSVEENEAITTTNGSVVEDEAVAEPSKKKKKKKTKQNADE